MILEPWGRGYRDRAYSTKAAHTQTSEAYYTTMHTRRGPAAELKLLHREYHTRRIEGLVLKKAGSLDLMIGRASKDGGGRARPQAKLVARARYWAEARWSEREG
jgi:hypothetical protein